jgi:ESCRT-II complex subunit VPS22
MPRRAGIGGLGQGLGAGGLAGRQAVLERAHDVGERLAAQHRQQMVDKSELFKARLEEFARKHKTEIVKNPDFRSKFNSMCSAIGVDPLASNKGMWGALGMGDFYYELGIQMIQVCMERRAQSGGLDSASDVLQALRTRRGPRAQPIDMEDMERAVKNLKALGRSLEVVCLKGKDKMIQSVPFELSHDHTRALEHAAATAYTSVPALQEALGWHEARAAAAVDFLVSEGMAWVDNLNGKAWPDIWFPSLWATQQDLTN